MDSLAMTSASSMGDPALFPPMNFADIGLIDGLDQDFVDINVRGTVGDPDEGVGNVGGDERVHAGINFIGTLAIAFETDEGEFGFDQAGIDGADANAGAKEFEAQGTGDGHFTEFGGAIHGAAGVGGAAGDGADIDDAGTGFVRHKGQCSAGDAEQAEDVALDHGVPIGILAGGNGIQSMSAAGIINEDVEGLLFQLLFQPNDEGVHAGSAGDIEFVNVSGGSAGFPGGGGGFFEVLQAAGAEEQFSALGGEGSGRSGAYAGRRAGDQYPFTFERKWFCTFRCSHKTFCFSPSGGMFILTVHG